MIKIKDGLVLLDGKIISHLEIIQKYREQTLYFYFFDFYLSLIISLFPDKDDFSFFLKNGKKYLFFCGFKIFEIYEDIKEHNSYFVKSFFFDLEIEKINVSKNKVENFIQYLNDFVKGI